MVKELKRINWNSILVQKFWLFPLLFSVTALIVEVNEHRYDSVAVYLNREYLFEVFFLSIVFPIILGLLIYYVKNSSQARDKLASEIKNIVEFSNNLAKSKDWKVLLNTIGVHLRTTIPIEGLYLSVYDPIIKNYQTKVNWIFDENNVRLLLPDLSEIIPYIQFDFDEPAKLCNQLVIIPAKNELNQKEIIRYCLPLFLNDTLFALIHIDLPQNYKITEDEKIYISSLASEILLTAENIYIKEFRSEQTDTKFLERKRIARMLHDTLAQDLAYLRLQLELLRDQAPLVGIIGIQQELKKMQKVANLAHEQIRGTLRNLIPETKEELPVAIKKLCEIVEERDNLQIKFVNTGNPRPLSTEVKRQFLNICKEALANAEKHADCMNVEVTLIWEEHQVNMEIQDFGKGFSPEDITSGNYGIKFMIERAESLKTELKILTEHNMGTKVAISVSI